MLKEKVHARPERQLTFHMDVELVDRIRKLAEENNTFISEIGRALIVMGLPTLEKRLRQERETRECHSTKS